MAKRGYVDTPEGQIHYQTQGEGEPLLLLHQACLSSEEYFLVIPILGKRYRVLALDLPAHGYSDAPERRFDIEDYARNVIHFFDGLGIDSAHIAGHHTGASITTEVAAAYPDRVRKIVLSGCPVYNAAVRGEHHKSPPAKFKYMEIAEDGSYLTRVWETEKGKSEPNPRIWHRMVVSHLLVGEKDQDTHLAVMAYDIEKRLPLIKCPALVLSGDRDVFYNKLGYTQSLIPNAEQAILKGGYLRPALDQPEEFSEMVLQFLKG